MLFQPMVARRVAPPHQRTWNKSSAALLSRDRTFGHDLGPGLEPMTLLKWALIFLVVSIIAGLLGFTGISAASADIARVLFYIFVVIFLVLLVLGLTVFRV
jgi:uncharacterized membrane protein YtjA (UPF0391 family)